MTRKEAEAFVQALVDLRALTQDHQAVQTAALFPRWKEGMALSAGDRIRYDGRLYRVLTAHTAQGDWAPDTAVSLFESLNAGHAGTREDPIPYGGNLTLEQGLFYTQSGTVYLCFRHTGVPVYADLAQLAGQYVTLAA